MERLHACIPSARHGALARRSVADRAADGIRAPWLGSYDAEKPMTVEAVIEDVELGNPHGMLMVRHDGRQWHVVLAPPSRMRARGATADVVAKGKTVKVYGFPRRDGSAEIRAEWIEVDGRRFELR
jgi:hypothetical protein